MADEDLEGQPDLEQLLDQVTQSAAERLHAAGPAVARSVDMTGGTVGAQPAVAKPGEAAEATIPDVQLLQLRTSKFEITIPVSAGDPLVIVHADRSLDEWAEGGGKAVQATDPRNHDITDALAIPLAPGGADSANLVIRRRAGTGLILIGGTVSEATHPAMLGDSFNTALQAWTDKVMAILGATPAAPISSNPLLMTAYAATKTALSAALSTKVKVG